ASFIRRSDMTAAVFDRPGSVNPLICRWDNRLYPPRPGPYNGPFLGYGAAAKRFAHTGSAHYC
ncbi:hypothetical protein KY202_004948, partial [Serratia marcescens]